MVHVEDESFRKGRLAALAEKRLAETFRFASGDHSATTGRGGHGSGPAQYLQLYRGALDAGDAQSYTTVVDLVVAEVLEQGAGYLGQTEPLLVLHEQRNDRLTVDVYGADLRQGTGR